MVWIVEQPGLELKRYDNELFNLGLRVEGFPKFDLYAVDVPASVDVDAVNTLPDRLEDLGFSLAFPVWRH